MYPLEWENLFAPHGFISEKTAKSSLSYPVDRIWSLAILLNNYPCTITTHSEKRNPFIPWLFPDHMGSVNWENFSGFNTIRATSRHTNFTARSWLSKATQKYFPALSLTFMFFQHFFLPISGVSLIFSKTRTFSQVFMVLWQRCYTSIIPVQCLC